MTTTDDPVPALIRSLRSRVATDRQRAAKDLGRLGILARDSLPVLAGALRDDDGKVREAAAQAIGQMGPDAIPAIVGMLAHEDKYVRRNAVWALGKLGPAARPALPALGRALKDPDPRTASGAAQALGNMGTDGADAVPALVEAMRGTNIVLCRLAAKALSSVGTPALATLISHLQHSDPFVRGEAALALGWMGAKARSAVPFLARIARGPNADVSQHTPPPVGTLGMMVGGRNRTEAPNVPDSAIVTPTGPASTEGATPEEICRIYAAQALGRIGAAAASAVPDLRIAARSGPTNLRQAARFALRQIEGV